MSKDEVTVMHAIADLLADAYTRLRERNLATNQRWSLNISAGEIIDGWEVNIHTHSGKKWFSASGNLEPALQSVLEQWQRYCDSIDESEG